MQRLSRVSCADRLPVPPLAEQWVTDSLQVDADLVSAAGFDPDTHEASIAGLVEGLEPGDGFSAIDIRVDQDLRAGDSSMHHTDIGLSGGRVLEFGLPLPNQCAFAGEQIHSGRIRIQLVDGPDHCPATLDERVLKAVRIVELATRRG